MKKLLTTLLAIAMILAMCIPVMADTTTTTGNPGSITITNATEGRTYTAYKIFSATGAGDTVAYTTDSTGKGVIETDTNAPFEVSDKADANGQYSVTAKSVDETMIINWISANYSKFATIGKTGTYAGGTYTISDLPDGYYYVTTGTGTAISIDTVTGETKEIIDKNPDKPNNPSKTIIAEDGQEISDGVTANDAKVGSVETFKVSYNARNTVTTGTGKDAVSEKITKFCIEDTPVGLEIDSNSVTVAVNGTELAATAYTMEITAEGTLKITIPWMENNSFIYTPEPDANASGNIPVVVTYDATVTADAAKEVAENTVEIKYMPEGSSSYEGDVTNPDDPPKTTTYTYGFQLNKTDENNSALAGARFELYDDENAKVAFVENGATYRLATADDTTTTTTIDMTENTTVYITGLDNETYTLKEIKAPDGYNLAAGYYNWFSFFR